MIYATKGATPHHSFAISTACRLAEQSANVRQKRYPSSVADHAVEEAAYVGPTSVVAR